jgi:ABC-type multidrug transport system fused ATPase/permease subunit
VTVDPPDLGFAPTAKRLLRLWRLEWRYVTLGITTAFGVTLLTLVIAVLIERTVDTAITTGEPSKAPPLVASIVVCAVVRFGLNFTRRWSTSQIGIRIEARIRKLLYDAYLVYPRRFYDQHATGQVLSRATNDLYPIRYFIGWGMVQMVQSAMMIIGVSVVLLTVNPLLALCAGLVMPLIAVLTWRFAKLVIPISREAQQRSADVTEAADEGVVGIEMVQAFGREPEVRDRFSEKASSVRDVVLRAARVQGRYIPGLTFLPTLAIALVLGVGGELVIRHQLTLGQFVLFNTLLLQLAWPLEALGWILDLGQRAIASASRSYAWLDGISPVPEPAEPTALPDGPLAVGFDGVWFSYDAGTEVLRGVSALVAAGEIVAVCGATGSGKSTLLGLLPRFYDPDQGRVTLGGVAVGDVPLADLRRAVAVVTQRPVLFSVTLRENLVAARPDASDQQLAGACDAAGVSMFVDDLPDGLETLIGERGVNLSGGQRQRVALARALLSDARVLVLDDPLSAVDTETERELVDNLRPAVDGRTVLIATQRLSTVRAADRVVVIRDGVVIELGVVDDLLVSGGEFAALFGDEAVRVG